MTTNGIHGPGGPGKVTGPRPGESTPRAESDLQKQQAPEGFARNLDKASISEKSAEVARYREMAELHREAFGEEDRSAKLDQVRARIASGHYDQPEVMDRIAGAMTDSAASLKAGASEMDEVRARSASGFYDRDDVMDSTAENVLAALLGQSRQR